MGANIPTRVDNEPAHQPTGVEVEGGRAPRAMPASSLTAPRGRTESEALTALPSASAIGIGTLALHSSCPWEEGRAKFDNAAFRCGWFGCHICAHPLRGVQKTKSDCRSKLSTTRERSPFLRRVPCYAAARKAALAIVDIPLASCLMVQAYRGELEARLEGVGSGTLGRANPCGGRDRERARGWREKEREVISSAEGAESACPRVLLVGWLSARPTPLIRIEYRNVIVMMGSCRQQRVLGMALDLLVSADVGRFPLNRLTARQTT